MLEGEGLFGLLEGEELLGLLEGEELFGLLEGEEPPQAARTPSRAAEAAIVTTVVLVRRMSNSR